MNTRALNSLADLICRAQEQDRTPMGIAFAVDAAGRHMTPETAAELEHLRARVAELLAERHETNQSLSDAAEALREQRDRFETLRALCDAADHVGIVSGGWFTVEAVRRAVAGEPLPKPDGITRAIVPMQALREPEGEFHAFLHHAHTTSHDLPELGGQR